MIKPKRLQVGDAIGIIAPAGPIKQDDLMKALPCFQRMGLRVKLGENVKNVHGYLAGTDDERLRDLHAMFHDPEVKAIFCARGGYGTPRLVDKIEYDLIEKNAKILWGYSDITYLHNAIHQKTGLITFHGPMVTSDMAKPEFDKLSYMLFSQLFEPTTLLYTETISPLHVICPGMAKGKLVGGNLSLIVSTLGTPYEIDTKDCLLLIEDIDETPYKVDSMLNQLKLAGKLHEAAGIVIGDFANSKSNNLSLTLDEIYLDFFANLGIPVMSGFKIGHCFPHFSVPLGVEAILNTEQKSLRVSAGVC